MNQHRLKLLLRIMMLFLLTPLCSCSVMAKPTTSSRQSETKEIAGTSQTMVTYEMPFSVEEIEAVHMSRNEMSLFATYSFDLERLEETYYLTGNYADEDGEYLCLYEELKEADWQKLLDFFQTADFTYTLDNHINSQSSAESHSTANSTTKEHVVLDENSSSFYMRIFGDSGEENEAKYILGPGLSQAYDSYQELLDLFKALTKSSQREKQNESSSWVPR